jgi:hypothetical protein
MRDRLLVGACLLGMIGSGASFAFGEGPAAEGDGAFGNTPAGALRTFLVAMATHDAKALRGVVTSTEGVEWLFGGMSGVPTPIRRARAEIGRVSIKSLKPGDEVPQPNGRAVKIRAGEVAEDKAVLLAAGSSTPTHVSRGIDGRWKVDAAPLIAARKASVEAEKKAEAARRKAAQKQQAEAARRQQMQRQRAQDARRRQAVGREAQNLRQAEQRLRAAAAAAQKANQAAKGGTKAGAPKVP